MRRTPWKRICQILEALELERSPAAFLLGAARHVQRLVRADHVLAIHMIQRDFRRPAFFIPLNAPSGFWEEYLAYYNRLDPHYRQEVFDRIPAVTREHVLGGPETEFKRDFLRAHDTGNLLQMSDVSSEPGEEFFLCLYRGRRDSFTDADFLLARVLQPHLHGLFQTVVAAVGGQIASDLGGAADAAGLSRREREIAGLLAQRFSTAEIADRLFISARTVSKHLEHIYSKLNVHRRTDVPVVLRGREKPAGAEALWRVSAAYR